MYIVIFTAEVNYLDDEYSATAARMRELATEKYGCTGFVSCCENGREIAVSYWPSEAHILAWKNDPEHRAAQRVGRTKWYRSYRVDVAETTRSYSR